MRDRYLLRCSQGVIAAALFTATCLGTAAQAQDPGGPGRFRGGPGGPGGFGRGPRAATVTDVPASALAAGLNLSADQVTKITAIQERLQQQRQELLPRRSPGRGPGGPGGPGDDGGVPPPPPDRDAMREAMDKVRTLEQNAVRDIRAVLSDAQKQALPAALKEMDDLRAAGIPLEIAANLDLTTDQKTRIAAIAQKAQQAMRRQQDGAALRREDFGAMRDAMRQAREKTREEVRAVLTEEQRAMLAKYLREHPQRGPGGPGGPGRGGFRGGPGGGGPEGGPGGPPPF